MSMDGTGHTAEFWDFNDLIWQDTSALNPNTADWMPRGSSLSTILHSCTAESPNSNLSLSGLPLNLPSPASSTEAGHALVENFLDSVAPPILAAVEFGPRWTSTKMLFASLASASDMVRYAIMAFSALQIGDQDPSTWHKHKLHYDKAAKSFTSYMNDVKQARNNPRLDLQSPLATSFFLAYNALLTNRVDEAQSVLKEAAALVHTSRTKNFTLSEKRLFSWVRLVDARACLAGGEGAFLQETDSEAFSPDAHPKEELQLEADVPTHSMDAQIEEVLFDVLHSPGLIFYQRVQSIMARVSKIDPWHRSRGTVADETEVMRIAEDIRQDLEQLGGARPSLTDHAVSGRLSDRHLGWSIAVAITHSYRLYWANYEAAFIHLHRVAHKHLPVTKEVLRARTTIKRIARLLQQDDDRPLPVNFIWPLLMACCEEDILDERKWMIGAIRSMQSGTSNAKPIADVLEEVHRRQDATGHRVDVRQTSVDLFNMSFAVF
ncbi:putative C6 finger domain protein [Taphrina deformans PYCC 5710]|uniref:C6 finger domain protein n=1 Tax=Taphrina deformans (strain PYCC 5710 / ATCC 11124 / CBS 356.35 / IMI 108563 / JCM 9778 / NBRC 8474) TaxID=1097556 RepID=R4XCC1_TAPDE|nr:putative C6 finger domain protein [Taphrina deformans PYCC 5710]|eukprot:CCG82021.1 putative C6 finger domain protein [Taphrina deformans PYCC 5710]